MSVIPARSRPGQNFDPGRPLYVTLFEKSCSMPNMSAPPRRCWVGNTASSVCAVGQRTHPAEVQSEPHLPPDVVLGQLVTERIGLENGIVLSFSSQPQRGSGAARSRLVLGANTFSPTEVGALSVVAHPDIGQRLSFLFFRLALLLVSQPVEVYHLTHSITLAVGSLLPEVSHLKS